ncbi:MAG: class I SAM-dependent RNA methyltransferase [Acidimicrobiales bacterium]
MPGPAETLRVTNVAVGGDGVARELSGRVVLVAGALPGELVDVEVVDERRDRARAVVVGVREAAPARAEPPCPFVAAGCGGCGWQHVAPAAQRELKVDMVADALRRQGGVADPWVAAGPTLDATGYRTTLRGVADDGGRFALRRHRSHDLVAVPACLVAHPLVAEVLAEGRFPPGADVTVRVGARTGERMVVVDGLADPADAPESADVADAPESAGFADAAGVAVPGDVRVVTGAELAAGRRAWIHEEVAGHRLRVSARSFFQARPDGAEALVDAVRTALDGALAGGARLADLYGGVGLFAVVLAGDVAAAGDGRVEVVEASASSAADARINVGHLGPRVRVRVVRCDVARWRPRRMDAVIADPPRAGLGRGGARAVAATRAGRLALVSCDVAALGRDVRLLAEAGYGLVDATLVDLFPHTPHVEVVSRFDRMGSG